jgi:carbon storage regulator CsrA
MLVLTRRPGEQIVIARDIRVTVVAVKGQSARLGIAAPPSVPVVRQELLGRRPQGTGPSRGGTNIEGRQQAPHLMRRRRER